MIAGFVLFRIMHMMICRVSIFFFFQAEDGIRDLVRSRGLGDVYKRQIIILISSIAITFGCIFLKDYFPTAELVRYTDDGLSLIHI